ncbi:MAG: metal-dependent transcriptional regulator [Actinomycetales bacterium]|nr:metal-dependent transcriptional regulator [Actinomycetales bacterium]
MVKRLAAQGLVEHRPYGAIRLTEAGRTQALRMVRRHRLVETWLVVHFGYGWDEVHDEAEVLEHSLSDRLLDAIDEELGRPQRDPHGDPIPDRTGTPPRVVGMLASEIAARGGGAAGALWRVARISDRDPRLLRELEGRGLGLDDLVELEAIPRAARDAVWLAPAGGA